MYMTEQHCIKILKELDRLKYPRSWKVNNIRYRAGDVRGLENAALASPLLSDFPQDGRWGEKRENTLFRMDVSILPEMKGGALVFEVETGTPWDIKKNPQFLMSVDGVPWQGLDRSHTGSLLTRSAVSGEIFRIALDGFPGMREGSLELNCFLKELDLHVERLYFNLKILSDMSPRVKDQKIQGDLWNFMERTMALLDLRKPDSGLFRDSVDRANRFLEEEFYGAYCGNHSGTVLGVGHTHIDVAWLWPISETRQKVVRSFSTVLRLMEDYPEYLFMSSQPQLYRFLKEDQPDLYEKVRNRVREGRWEPEGGMWLEADCNLAGGESLVRQFLFGCRFFRDEFNTECRVLWLPDVFGYSAALPQIMQQCHIKYFMTTKIFWNEYNRFPYETFEWEGMDGSRVLSHFITATDTKDPSRRYGSTYNGVLSTPHVFGTFENYSQKTLNDTVLMSFGYGDGGGGPTREMLEEGRRLQRGIPGAPGFRMTTSRRFFEDLDARVRNHPRLPQWVGELYLEYHRGTYTSVGKNKRKNRKCELLLRDLELFGCFAEAEGLESYPGSLIRESWEKVLLHQFHDILPGSSIREVYEDSDTDYGKVMETCSAMLSRKLQAIASGAASGDDQVAVFNQLSFHRRDLVRVKTGETYTHAVSPVGMKVPGQMVWEDENSFFLFPAEVPSMGYSTYRLITEPSPIDQAMTVHPPVMENRFFRISFDSEMRMMSLLDKRCDRELVLPGEKANRLMAYEDKPINWDAWDINLYYRDKCWEIDGVDSVEVTESGPVRGSLRIRRTFLDSTLVQDIRIFADIPRIDFETRIDWQEQDILLKASFPMDIHTSKATYDIQFGNVERPTHWNTSWDSARFEVCAHKWADISEEGWGVSLLNDCKYGHDIKGSTMQLTLLKSAMYPYPDADRGHHQMLYSLYPHSGGFRQGNTVSMAYMLNCPLLAVKAETSRGMLPPVRSFLEIDRDNVVVETVKKAESGDGIIIRVYECHNRRDKVTLTFSRSPKAVTECNLLEEDHGRMDLDGNRISFQIRPYEIKTFRILF